MESVGEVCRGREACFLRGVANGNAKIGKFGSDEQPDGELARKLPSVGNADYVVRISLRIAGILVGAETIDQTDRIVGTELIVVADTAYRGVGIVVTRLLKTQQAKGTGQRYGAAARESIGTLQSGNVACVRSGPINRLVRDIVTSKTRNGVPERSTDTGNPQIRAASETEGALRDVGKLIDELYEPALGVKTLSQGQLLIITAPLLRVRRDVSADRIIDRQKGVTPGLEQTEIPEEKVIGGPTGAAVLTRGIFVGAKLKAGNPITVAKFGHTQSRRLHARKRRSVRLQFSLLPPQ